MARARFDEQLTLLDTLLLKMHAMVEQALDGTIRVLETRDAQLAEEIIEADEQVDELEQEIEALCMRLLLHQQPVARDLRTISAALKMITDIERIGDQAADICKIVRKLTPKAPYSLQRVEHMIPLGHATVAMVSDAVNAFVNRDLEMIAKVIVDDDMVDKLYHTVRRELLSWMREWDDPDEVAIELLLIAKYFERIGDHAQNIAEWVEYSLTGHHKGVLLT